MTPRCGRPMRRFEAVWGTLPEAPACGRPEGHNGQHRSVMGVERKRQSDWARTVRARRAGRYARERSRAA